MKYEGKRAAKRLAAGLAAAGLAIGALAFTGVTPAGATQSPTITRITGLDRYATSANSAVAAFPAGANNFVLVSGTNFPDGLSAAVLAGTVAGPVLLTNPNGLQGSTANAIATLDAKLAGAAKIFLVGGTSAVSAAQEAELTSLGYTVERISGADRYATAAAVAAKAASLNPVGIYNLRKTAILVTGASFPDALAAGRISYQGRHPILLTDSAALSTATQTFLDSETVGIGRVIIVGGTSAVSAAVATSVAAIKNGGTAIDVVRVAGDDRYATAVALATTLTTTTALNGFGWTSVQAVLVSGENFADALSSAALGTTGTNTQILLTPAASLNSSTETFLKSKASTITDLFVIGGTTAISAATATSATAAVTTATPTATIAGAQGAKTVTVTFSEAMVGTSGVDATPADGTGIGAVGTYKLNNVALAIDTLAGPGVAVGKALVTVSADKKTATITLGTALATSDVITVTAAAVTADNRAVAPTNFTVVADTVKPTATLSAFVGSAYGMLTVSEPVTFATNDVKCNGANPTSVTQVSGTLSYEVLCAASLSAAQSISIAAGAITDLAGLTNAAAVNGLATVDAAPATLVTAKLTKTVNAQASVTTTGTGRLKLAAKAGGLLDGTAGNAFSIQVIDNDAAPAVMLVDTLARKMVIGADLDGSASLGVIPSAAVVKSALDANAVFAAVATAEVTVVGNFDATLALTALTNGSSTYSIDLTLSEAVRNGTFVIGAFDTDANGDGTVDGGLPAGTLETLVSSNSAAGTMSITVTAGSPLAAQVVGTSKLVMATSVLDLAGNTLTAVSTAVLS